METVRTHTSPLTDMAKDLELDGPRLTEKYRSFRDQAKFYYRIRRLTRGADAALNTIENLVYRYQTDRAITAPIFLLGNFRSGTSFLEKIISDHSAVGHFTYCSQIFPRSPILTSALIRMFPFLNQPMVPIHMPSSVTTESPYEGEPIWRYCKNNCWSPEPINILDGDFEDRNFERLLRTVIQKHLISQKSDRFLNKNPWNTLRVGYLNKLFPDAKFIYITRHPHRQLQSQLDLERICHKVLSGMEKFNEAFSDQFYPPRIFFRTHRSPDYINIYSKDKVLATAMSIVDFDQEFDRQIASIETEDRLYRIRYEDLIDKFKEKLVETFDFLGLDTPESNRIIEMNHRTYLRRDLVSANSELPKFNKVVELELNKLIVKHGYPV